MDPSHLPESFRDEPRLLDALWRMLMEEIGGPRMIELLYRHHVERHSLRQLADAEGVAVGTLRGRLDKARATLARVELWPGAWDAEAAVKRRADEDRGLRFSVRLMREAADDSSDVKELTAEPAPPAGGSVDATIFEAWLRAVKAAR